MQRALGKVSTAVSKPGSCALSCVAMIKIAGTKSNDKINFKKFVDFFYKVD